MLELKWYSTRLGSSDWHKALLTTFVIATTHCPISMYRCQTGTVIMLNSRVNPCWITLTKYQVLKVNKWLHHKVPHIIAHWLQADSMQKHWTDTPAVEHLPVARLAMQCQTSYIGPSALATSLRCEGSQQAMQSDTIATLMCQYST